MPRYRVKVGHPRPPVWAGVPSSLTLDLGQTHNFASYASDPNGGVLTFSLVSGPGSISTAGLYTAATSGSIVVRVTDNTGLTADTGSISITASDVTAPTVPTITSVAQTGALQITVTWSASTDASTPITYTIERSANQTTWAALSTTQSLSYVDNSLTGASPSYYRVKATDTRGNASNYSATATLGPVAPQFTVAPTSASIASSGGTIQFTAADLNGTALTYSLPTTRAGITVNSGTGLVTVASSAAGTIGSITVRATDAGGLYAETSCNVTVQAAPAGTLYFENTFDGSLNGWRVGGNGTVPTFYTSGGASGSAYNGTGFIGWPMVVGVTNDYSVYRQTGGTPAAPAQTITNFYAQFALSHGGAFGIASGEEKLAIFEYVRSTAANFLNGSRKFQVVPCVLDNGQYAVELVEMNETGDFLRNAFCYQNTTTVGPATAANQWDHLRIQVQLDTNGSAVSGEYGVGYGNGIIRMWRNGTLIIEYTNVNICRAQPILLSRTFLTPSHSPYLWDGDAAPVYYDYVQMGDSAAALAVNTAGTRVVTAGTNNPDNVPAGTVSVSKDYSTEVASDIDPWRSDPLGPGVLFTYGANYGVLNSGGWRAQPNPINGAYSGGYADPCGWPVVNQLAAGPNALVSLSFCVKMTSAFLSNIQTGGYFSDVNKFIDLGTPPNRIGMHFGKRVSAGAAYSYPQFWWAGTGGGDYIPTYHDWTQHADAWVWFCLVLDGRSATASQRTATIYVKREGQSNVTRVSQVHEGQVWYDVWGNPQTMYWSIAGAIPGTSSTPLFGYWDDMNNREAVAANLPSMFLYCDRIRVCSGWPTGADGPPF